MKSIVRMIFGSKILKDIAKKLTLKREIVSNLLSDFQRSD